MQASFEQIQQAFIDEYITLEQLIEILIDNFGIKQTNKILVRNLQIALKDDE